MTLRITPAGGRLVLGPRAGLTLSDGGAAPFSPSQLPGLVAWYDAGLSTLYQDSARTTLATADTNPVGSWSDLSGVLNHLSQPTSGLRPVLKTVIQNGLAVVRFTAASTQWMQVTGLPYTQPVTAFVVGKVASNAAQQSFFGQLTDINVSTTKFQAFAGASLAGANADTAWHTHCAQFNSTSSLMRTDGVQTTGDTGTNVLSTIKVGTFDTATQFLGGDLGALIFYNTLLSGTQITQVEAYLKARWGTP